MSSYPPSPPLASSPPPPPPPPFARRHQYAARLPSALGLSAFLAALLAPRRAVTCRGGGHVHPDHADTYEDGWNNAGTFTRSSDAHDDRHADAGPGTAAPRAPADDGGCHAFAVSAGSTRPRSAGPSRRPG